MENVSDDNREARIQELRNLVKQGEYQIDPEKTAARLLDEHLKDRLKLEQKSRSAAAAAPNPVNPPK